MSLFKPCSKEQEGFRSVLKVFAGHASYNPCPECGLIHRKGKPEDGKKPEQIVIAEKEINGQQS